MEMIKILSPLIGEDGIFLKTGEIIKRDYLNAMELVERGVAEYVQNDLTVYEKLSKKELLNKCKEKNIKIDKNDNLERIKKYLYLYDYYYEKNIDYLKKLCKKLKLRFNNKVKKNDIINILVGYDEFRERLEKYSEEEINEIFKEIPIEKNVDNLTIFIFYKSFKKENLIKICKDEGIFVKDSDNADDLVLKLLN
jgi:hypothetical protein